MRPPPSSTLFPYTTLFRSFQIASGHYKQGFPILHHDTLYIMDLLLPKNNALYTRSEERRVGKECRSSRSTYDAKKNTPDRTDDEACQFTLSRSVRPSS